MEKVMEKFSLARIEVLRLQPLAVFESLFLSVRGSVLYHTMFSDPPIYPRIVVHCIIPSF